MSVAHGQAKQALHPGVTDGGEADVDTPLEGHLIDWDNLDSVSLEELSDVDEAWNSLMLDIAAEAPAAPTSKRERKAAQDGSEISVRPLLQSWAVEDHNDTIGFPNDLDFSDYDFSEFSGNDFINNEVVNASILPGDFVISPNLPRIPTAAIGTNGRCSETRTTDQVEPVNTKYIRLAKRNPNFIANIIYTPLSTAPRPWHIFTYTEHGELNPGKLFTAAEVHDYLWRHPMHEKSNNRRSSPLTLRIHRNPPASQDRYPTNPGSHRCRFHECPADNNTIDKGQFIVMFDELSAIQLNHDPYLAAGYVHLYCLERFLDFPKICANLNVQTESRCLDKEDKNAMKLDPKQVEKEADSFIEICRKLRFRRPDGYPCYKERSDVTGKPYEGTLTHRMHLAKLKNRSRSINKQEAAREKAAGQKGGSLGSHLGDLVLANTLRQATRKHTKQNRLVAHPRQKRRFKEDKVVEGCEDANDDVEPIHGKKDLRPKQLRRSLPPHSLNTASMLPSTTQQITGHRFLPTSDSKIPSMAPRYPLYQLDEDRRFILQTDDLPSPASSDRPQQYGQPQQCRQPFNTQTHAYVQAPAPRVEHPQHGGLEKGGQTKKRSSDEASNDKAPNLLEGHTARSLPQDSSDAAAGPIKKFKESYTSIPLALARNELHQRRARQRQVLLKQSNSRPLPPPPAMPQAPQAGFQRRADEAGIPAHISSHHVSQMQHTQSSSKSQAPLPALESALPPIPHIVSTTGSPTLQSQAQPHKLPLPIANIKQVGDEGGHPLQQDTSLGDQQGHALAQDNPYSLRHGYPPTHRATHGDRPQNHVQQGSRHDNYTEQASETPELRRRIHEDYEKYMQQNSGSKIQKSQTPRKKRVTLRGNDGKLIKNKQRTVSKASKMNFDGQSQKKLLQEQQRLLVEAELRQDEERASRQMEIIEQEEAELRQYEERAARQMEIIEQEEAKLKAEEEQYARQREIIEQEEAKLRAEDEEFARQKKLKEREERER